MSLLKIRRRAFAPKVRTGCERCKARRIKCDETKPICVRCRSGKFDCNYNVPNPWLFEGTSSKNHDPARQIAAVALTCLRPGLETQWGTPEERHALQFYLCHTGPWLANYGPHSHRDLWEIVYPRFATSLPATRHLLTAITLLETPIGSSQPSVLGARSLSITRKYTQALHELTIRNPHHADVALAPVLAWLLESLTFNEVKASIHSRGASRIFKVHAAEVSSHASDEYVFDEKLNFVLDNVKRFRCMRSKAEPFPSDEDQMFQAVAVRNEKEDKVTTQQLRTALANHFAIFDPEHMTQDQLEGAQRSIRRWEVAILQNRYTSNEPAILFNALHFLCNLAVLLLPKPVAIDVAGDETVSIALDYVLDQSEEMLKTSGLTADVKLLLEATILIMLHAVSRFAPDRRHRERADKKARVIGRINATDGPP